MERNPRESQNPPAPHGLGREKIKPIMETLSDKKGIHTLVKAAEHFGVQHVIISPGSRNAPMTISFNRSGKFTCHSIADERVAGFYALGMALATGKPVIILCTSGTASANYAPAMAEAFYLRAPVVAVTADRPLAWTDQGNGQTIRQENIFKNFSRFAFSLIAEPTTEEEEWLNRRKLSQAFNAARTLDPGPIHINVPVREPLYGVAEYGIGRGYRFYDAMPTERHISSKRMEDMRLILKSSKKVMVLAGQMKPNPELEKAVTRISELPNAVVLTETTSNLDVPLAIDAIDRIIMAVADDKDFIGELMPDLLITIGGYVVSKKLKSLLRQHRPANHWHVHPFDEGLDTYMSLTREIHADPAVFLDRLAPPDFTELKNDYSRKWQRLKSIGNEAHDTFDPGGALTDFRVFSLIYDRAVPEKTVWHLANSTPVRYVQLMGFRSGRVYHGNRGTSGIDGSMSTAAGWAVANPDQTMLMLIGDTSFVYDSNALWNRDVPKNLKIVVINNGGGGIFRIIEGPAEVEELEPFFEAHHPADIKSIAAAFGLEYFHADQAADLEVGFDKLMFETKKAAVLEVTTPAKGNAQVLKDYFARIGKELGKR